MDLCCDCVFDVGSGSNYADIMVIEWNSVSNYADLVWL